MASDRKSLQALRNLISEADLILETTPPLPENRTGAAREALRAALVLTEDLIGQSKMSPAAALGHKGGNTTARKLGTEQTRDGIWTHRSRLGVGRATGVSRTIKLTPNEKL